ncbi:MAG: asparagine synthase (glutamine-hydrolyzing), partial [Deltaproteobacteria bacterium]
ENNQVRWRGHSDTEVLLSAIGNWGLQKTLDKCRGMFAFALWDKQERKLNLVRDRIGQKPLYYGKVGNFFAFASELKALCTLKEWNNPVNWESTALFLRYGYIPSPSSIYQNIFKLPPGCLVQVDSDGRYSDPISWWSFDQFALQNISAPFEGDENEMVRGLQSVLAASVKEQMVADVPVGALLSGGIDSSLIVSLAQSQSSQPIKTFTVGFSEGQYDEMAQAKEVATHLRTDHTELRVSYLDALKLIPKLSEIFDEPFGDSSQIPTSLVFALTNKFVKVCLSGDAGDEMFGGYNRYFWTEKVWSRIERLPKTGRSMGSQLLFRIPTPVLNGLYRSVAPALPSHMKISNPGDKLHKLAGVLGAESPENLYQLLVSQWRGELPLLGIKEPSVLMSESEHWLPVSSLAEKMMAVDSKNYLPDDILVKVDRSSMAASMESRIPFLDERVMEFAWRLPMKMKLRSGEGKWILKKLLDLYVPKKLVDRPKQGFGVPIESWLRGPLRDWAEDLLSVKKLNKDGVIDPAPVRKKWAELMSGKNVQHAVWNVLMYQAWRERWR